MADVITLEQGVDFDYAIGISDPPAQPGDAPTPTPLRDVNGNLIYRVVFTVRNARGGRHVRLLLDTAAIAPSIGSIDIEPGGQVGDVVLHLSGAETAQIPSDPVAVWELVLVNPTDPTDVEPVIDGIFTVRKQITGALT